MANRNRLEFDIVLATRNRQAVLALSIPLMLRQSRLPRRFIVVDASEDHAATIRTVTDLFGPDVASVELLILKSEVAGSSHQRNVGLAQVTSPVVIFPDDDVFWYPGVTDAVMRVYERDADQVIGCVATSVASAYPAGVFTSDDVPYQLELRDRVAKYLRRAVGPIEEVLFCDPINPGRSWMEVWGSKQKPAWLEEENVELCGPIFGYRMSFRTEVIRALGGFDALLGRYSMFEDSDASVGSLRLRSNVCARRAQVFHYRVPGERVRGSEFGVMAILNRTYVTCKHSAPRSLARRKVKRFLYYKIFRYLLQTYTAYGRSRFWGACRALPEALRLTECTADVLQQRYVGARLRLLGENEIGPSLTKEPMDCQIVARSSKGLAR